MFGEKKHRNVSNNKFVCNRNNLVIMKLFELNSHTKFGLSRTFVSQDIGETTSHIGADLLLASPKKHANERSVTVYSIPVLNKWPQNDQPIDQNHVLNLT